MTTANPAASTATGARMRATLNDQKASTRFFDALRSGTKAARSTAQATFKAARLDKAKGLAENVYGFARDLVMRFLVRPAAYFGWLNLLGTALTAGALRDGLRTALKTAYRAARWPIAKVLQALTWPLRKFGWGATACAFAVGTVEWTEDWVADKVNRGFDFLDAHETGRVMRLVRGAFQFSIVVKALRLVLRKAPGWVVLILALLVPIFGMRDEDASAIKLADEANSDRRGLGATTIASVTSLFREERRAFVPAEEVVAEPTIEKDAVHARLTVPWKGMPKDAVITLTTWIDPVDNERRYQYDGTVYKGDASMQHLELGWVDPKPAPAPAPAKAASQGPRPSNRSTARQSGGKSTSKPTRTP